MNLPHPDPELFAQAASGDREAFWELVSPYRGLIFSVGLGIFKDPERAEDQLHDCLLEAFRSLGNLRDTKKFPSWLFSLARYRAMEVIRKEQRMRGAAQGAAYVHNPVVATQEWMEKEAWLQRMEEAIQKLPEPFRIILSLKYTNDYSCREISEILDITLSAVKSRLFEARKLLRKTTEKLAKNEEAEGDKHGLPKV